MIQRKQSIWFFLACALLVASYFFPVGAKEADAIQYEISTHEVLVQQANRTSVLLDYTVIGIGFVAIGVLMILNIFVYKNRNLQKSIAMFGLVFTLLLYFGLSYFCNSLPGGINDIQVNVGLFLPLAAVMFIVLGIRGINSDIKLLKSADRLR